MTGERTHHDFDRGITAPLDWLRVASDPRVVAVVLARDELKCSLWPGPVADSLQLTLADNGITATEDQARALLDAVAEWDEHNDDAYGTAEEWAGLHNRLTAAVTAIVGEAPGE